jgi:4-amino-4-deoxy-L-arabinose transferase-like glycosyltransferase
MSTRALSWQVTVSLLAALSVLALLVRVAYVAETVIVQPIRADARQYVSYGYNLAHHGTFSSQFPSDDRPPDSLRSPGYPLLIACAFRLGAAGDVYDLIIHAQIVLSTLVVLLTYFVGRLFLSRQWAITAAALVALSPHQVSLTSYVLTETLFCFLLILASLCFAEAMRASSALLSALSGILFGATYLTNETALLIPVLFAAVILLAARRFEHSDSRRRLRARMVLFIVTFSLFPGGWMMRNATSVPPDMPRGTDRALANLSHGAYPGFLYEDPRFKYFPYREDPMQPAFGSSLGDFARILWARVRERPFRYMTWYLFEKPYHLWSWNILQGQGDVYVYPVETSLYQKSRTAELTRLGMKGLHPVILLLALAGIPLLWRVLKRGTGGTRLEQTPTLVAGVILYYSLLYVIFAPWPRYAVPLRPELYLLAVWSAAEVVRLLGERKRLDKSSSRGAEGARQ